MKKTTIAALLILLLTGLLCLLAGCTRYVDYSVAVIPYGENSVIYSYSDNMPVFTVYSDDEAVARIIFASGKAEGVALRSSAPAEFVVEIPIRYSVDEYRLLYNGDALLPSNITPLADALQYRYNIPAPDREVFISVEGLSGVLREYTFFLPVDSTCPLYLKKANDFVAIKEQSAELLGTLAYHITFETVSDKPMALFSLKHGETIEFYVTDPDAVKLYYSREGYGDTAPYNKAHYGGEEEGYTSADMALLISQGYAFMELTSGNYYWKVTQTATKTTTYLVAP